MRKHISLFYKSYDGNNRSEMERKINECFNDYGYNMESTKRREFILDEVACKSGPNCLRKCLNKEKR